MEGFKLKIKRKALKSIKQYPQYRERLIELFQTLKRNPIPFREYDVAKLRGYRDVYRIRIGKLRVIYQINWVDREITILVVAEREKAYKRIQLHHLPHVLTNLNLRLIS
ncbi:MAG: type II toxin-antitoxin system RelE/ParE family toxin [Thermoprotei archaeon]|nr:MAG: type II toxin-antitoxin system RelE/ParE family toxin [Thermoprotei archaeon]